MLRQLDRTMRGLLVGAAVFLAAPGAAVAGVDEVRGGVFLHDVGPFSTNKEDGVAFGLEALFDSPSALNFLARPRPMIGFNVAADNAATSLAYAGLSWRQGFGLRYFADFGLALAVHDGETKYRAPDPILVDSAYLGCRVLARLSLDIGMRLTPNASIAISGAHASNAGVCRENEGLDSLGLRFGLSF